MLNAYERGLVLSYLSKGFRFLRKNRWRVREVEEWLERNVDALAIEELTHRVHCAGPNDEPLAGQWGAVEEMIERARRASRSPPDLLRRRLEELGRSTALSEVDLALLDALLRYETQEFIENLFDVLAKAFHDRRGINGRASPTLACLLGVSISKMQERFSDRAPLVRAGLLQVYRHGLSVLPRLSCMASPSPTGPGDTGGVIELLFGNSPTTHLEWSDFEHLGQARDDVARLLGGAATGGHRGVNVLLHGPSGTGKTEFARMLAKHSGLQLVAVGEEDDDGDEPSRWERLGEWCLARSLLARRAQSLLLIDEMEDLTRQRDYSKVFMHRLLEETPVPTVWTTNGAGHMDPALLRRMTFAVEMRQPPPKVRARIWSRQLASQGIEATDAQALALAKDFDASPGVAAGAVAAAAISKGDIELVRRGVQGMSRLLGRDRPRARVGNVDPGLVDADVDLAALAERLTERGERRFSICLQGPPGSGKSAYARYLADRLGLEVVQKRASDLLSKWVGETEHNVAEVFAHARDDGAFLVFDEADSLLADRRGARRSWEITQVNEMLTWMEDHPLPFACTTNYGEKLDAAVLRRFTFKVTLDYASKESARGLFRRYFDLEPPPELDHLTALAPGDFPVVRRKAEVLGKADDPDALVEMLREECAAKPDQPAPIGFARP